MAKFYKIKKFALQAVQKARKLSWYILRPITNGARAIVVNKDMEVLLVQHTYTKGWFLPGGGVLKKETPKEAIKRELREEVGITHVSASVLGKYQNNYEYKKDTITVFIVKQYKMSQKSHFEIKNSKFFHPNILPNSTTIGTRKRIKEWLGTREKQIDW